MAEDGRPVPDEVSVVGFDDLPEAAYFCPPLTTVRQDFAELGRRALRLLVEKIAGASADGPQRPGRHRADRPGERGPAASRHHAGHTSRNQVCRR